jgi:hypothetical protein
VQKVRLWSLVIVFLSLVLIGFAAQTRGRQLAEQALAGAELRPRAVFNVVPISTSCVELAWIDSNSDPPKRPPNDGLYLYLGAADGTALLLDPETESEYAQLFRVPEASIVFSYVVTEPLFCRE